MHLFNFGLEAIAFQSPAFASEMTRLMDKILEERNAKSANSSQAAKDLIKLIRSTTGVKVDIVFDTEYPPCTLPYHINPDSILGGVGLKDYYVEESKTTLKRIKAVKETSSIDLKNAKVSGIFSEYDVPIYMGYDFLRHFKLSAGECVAILAHELGHCFVAYEMAFRTAKTNQVLSAISKAHGGGDKDAYNYVLKTTAEVYNLRTGVFDELVDSKSKETTLTVVLGHIEAHNKAQSVLGNTTYDITTFEAMADNFATRLGLGRELVTGLEKLFKTIEAAEFSQTTRTMLTIGDTFTVGLLILAPVAIVSGAALAGGFILTLMVFSIWARLDGRDHNNIYDKLSIRFKRIKEQIIQYLKDNKLPAKDVKIALQTIANMEKTIGEISEYKGYLGVVFNLLSPSSVAVNKAIDVQKKLESIASNDLYVKAAELRILD